MKNYLQGTVDSIKAIVPLTESQEADVKNQLYDLVTKLQRPIEKRDGMAIEEITSPEGFSFEISSDNPVYNEMIKQGGSDEKL